MTRLRVIDVMTRDVVTVRENASYKEIADILAAREVSALPVIDAAGHVLGVVSEADLLHKVEFQGDDAAPGLVERRRRRAARQKSRGDDATGLMTAPAVTIRPDASVVEAARRMDSADVKRLPVVDDAEALVGIVARRDLIRAFVLPDAAIHDEVIEQVLRPTSWATPDEIHVSVRDGVVTLTGEVELASMTDTLVRLTRAVDGVVDVVSKLTAAYDDVTRPVRYSHWGPVTT